MLKVPDYASLKSFAEDLKLMPISPRTQQAYLACAPQWAEHFNTAPDLISAEQLRQYLIHLKCIKKVARQTSTQVLRKRGSHRAPDQSAPRRPKPSVPNIITGQGPG